MTRDFPESDWKRFRQLSTVALDRICERVLRELTAIAADASQSHHDRYLKVYRTIHERDEVIADAFNNQRRSVAIHQLMMIYSQGLFTDEELDSFTPGTRDLVLTFAKPRKNPAPAGAKKEEE